MQDAVLKALCDQVQHAYESKTGLNIQGSGSKAFLCQTAGSKVHPEASPNDKLDTVYNETVDTPYNETVDTPYKETLDTPYKETLDTTIYQGIVQYEPTELVITAKAGTPISEVEQALDEQGQMLAFEPPQLGENELVTVGSVGGTIGGMVASGLAGPRRPWSGGVRDYVLGTSIINGRGEHLRFGGQVMKNVAGYDVSRLMVGSLGSLGVLADISLKVLPKPACQQFYRFESTLTDLFVMLQQVSIKMTPITGVSHDGCYAHVRLEGRQKTLAQFARVQNWIFEERHQEELKQYWLQVRHHQHAVFRDEGPRGEGEGDNAIWQLSLPKWSALSSAKLASLNSPFLMDWAGARYWLKADMSHFEQLKEYVQSLKGHLRVYRGDQAIQYPALSPAILKLHQNLKQAYDPAGILNPLSVY